MDFQSPRLAKRKGTSPGPLTRRMRSALCPEELKLADPKSLLAQMGAAEHDEASDTDFQPGAESEVEEEYDEGDAERDDERPPFADGGLASADPALVQQLDEQLDDGDDEDDFGPAEAAEGDEEEIAEEYDEGPVVDDERPPFEDAELASVDPALALELGVTNTTEEDEDADFAPGAEEEEVAEEYDEGPVVDDERPPFDDAELAAADPELVQQLERADDDPNGADFAPVAESDVEEEWDEGQVVDDERPPFHDE